MNSDGEAVNFSSLRHFALQTRDTYKDIQQMVVDRMMVPLVEQWVDVKLLQDRSGTDLEGVSEKSLREARETSFRARHFPWVDPAKDTQQNRELVEMGAKSTKMVAAENGIDLEDVIDDQLEFFQMIEAKEKQQPGFLEKLIGWFGKAKGKAGAGETAEMAVTTAATAIKPRKVTMTKKAKAKTDARKATSSQSDRSERSWRAADRNAPEHVKRMFASPKRRDARPDTIRVALQRAPSSIERGQVLLEERAIEIPVSNGRPLLRTFWGFVYEEVLVHSSGAVDLGRFASSDAMMLRDHDPRRPCGRIETAYLRGDTLWVRAVFPEGGPDLVEETWRGLATDLYRNVSVGWSALPENVEVVENPRDNQDLDFRVIYHEWSPMEASIVAVPADWSVGVGREMTLPITREHPMPQWLKDLLERHAVQINASGLSVDDVSARMVRDGVQDEAAANSALLGILAERSDPAATPAPEAAPVAPAPTSVPSIRAREETTPEAPRPPPRGQHSLYSPRPSPSGPLPKTLSPPSGSSSRTAQCSSATASTHPRSRHCSSGR